MKKIISIILVLALCLNSTGVGVALAQNNNQGIEDDFDKKEESIEEDSVNSEDETEKEETVETEENETSKEEDDQETDLETDSEEEPEEDTEEESQEETESKEIETDEVETEESEVETEEEIGELTEEETGETIEATEESIEETSESDDDAKIATLSEAEDIQVKNELYGWENYSVKKFSIYLDLSKTYDGKTLMQSMYPDVYDNRIELVSSYTDWNGRFDNGGRESDDLILDYHHWKNKLTTISIYYQAETETFEKVIPIRNKYGDEMYYVEVIKEETDTWGGGIDLKNEGLDNFFSKNKFKKVTNEGEEDRYELVLYPAAYNPLSIQSYTFNFIDPETGSSYGSYTDSISNYANYSAALYGFNNSYGSSTGMSIDFPVYTDYDKSGYVFKTWDDYQYTDTSNYNRTRKIHKGYKTLDCYDQYLDADVNKSYPYTFTYKLVPDQSDIYELPYSENEQWYADQHSNFVHTARVTRRDFTLTFEVYKMGDIKYYNNDGTVQIDNVWVAGNTQITTGRWPNSFPAPGVKYITGYFVRGWN